MKKFFVALMLMMLLTFSAEAKEVTVDGFGANREEALQNAERVAVEQVVGTFVNSETLVENAMVKLDEIYTHAQGFVSGVTVLSEGYASNGLYRVTARMNVSDEPNSALISQLETVMRLNDPRVTVIMLRDNAAAGTHDELAETALNDKLLTLGFSHVVDADIVANLENARLLERIYNGERGLVGIGSSLGADYLILGKTHTNSQNVRLPDYKNGGYKEMAMHVANADITAKIIKLSTGDIVGTFSVTARGNDVIGDNAERNAIRNAAETAAFELEKRFKKLAMTVRSSSHVRFGS